MFWSFTAPWQRRQLTGGDRHRASACTALTRTVLTCTVAVTCALALASCSSAPDSPGADVVSAPALARLKAALSQAEAIPPFAPPGPAVSASAVHGKSALVMPSDSQIDACSTQAQDFQQLGQQLGMDVTVVSDEGVPAQWSAGVQEAASAHAGAIAMLCGIVPQAVAPQLQAAHGANVAIVDGNYNDTSYYGGLDGETAVNTAQGITDDVDDAILQLGGQPLHALVVSTDSIVQGPAGRAAVTAQEKKTCPDTCTAMNLVVPIQDWLTEVQGDVHHDLVSHPDINAVIIVFDGMVQFAMPAVEQIHRPGLEIYTWGASRTVESYMLQKGSLIAADPGPDEQWDAYEAMDQVIRLLGGHPAASLTTESVPDRFWVPGNVSQFFGPGGSYGNRGFGGDSFISGFRQLWELPPAPAGS